jgi:hypothetical protein
MCGGGQTKVGRDAGNGNIRVDPFVVGYRTEQVMEASSTTSPPASSSNMDTTNGGGTPGSSSIEQPPTKKARKEMDDDRVQRAALFMIKSQLLSVPQVKLCIVCVCVFCYTNFVVCWGRGRTGGGDVMLVPSFFFHL